MPRIIPLLTVLINLLISCDSAPTEADSKSEPIRAREEQYIKHSNWYQVEFSDSYITVAIGSSAEDRNQKQVYLLAKNLSEIPENLVGTRIKIPVGDFALTSTTQIPLAVELGIANQLKGFPNLEYIADEQVKGLIEAGAIMDIAGENETDLEKLMALEPDIIMVYPWAGTDHERLREIGVTPVYNCDYLEETPLGRAEWIKLMGLLTDKRALADSIFSGIEARYREVWRKVSLSSSKPTVIAGDYYNGIWYAPGGKSYIARYLRDAGAAYLWHNDTNSASLELDFETLYDRAQQVDFWGTVVSSKNAVNANYFLAQNDLMADFKAYKERALFYCNSADVDYFGAAVLEPDIILKDLASIFHPTYFPDHKPVYFHQVSE